MAGLGLRSENFSHYMLGLDIHDEAVNIGWGTDYHYSGYQYIFKIIKSGSKAS
jgi:hypothetical protein